MPTVTSFFTFLLLSTQAYGYPYQPRTLDVWSGKAIRIPHVKRQVIQGPNHFQFNVLDHLAGIAPYFDSPGVQINPSPPDGCTVKKAAYLVRHSNIFANDFDFETYIEPFTSKLGNFTDRQAFANVTGFEFLVNWTTPITNASAQVEELAPSGAQSAEAFGQLIANTYPSLAPFNATNGTTFKIWTASAERSSDTAHAFAQGAFPGNVSQVVEIPEDEDASANSLAPHESCPAFDGAAGSQQNGEFIKIYTAPIIERLNTLLPSFNFTSTDIVAMQELCGYETVIRNSSDFCNAFQEVDWLGFEYANDLMYFYSMGYGSTIAPFIGMPWLNATTALLESTNTSQNLYFSFAHREEIPLTATALGIFNNSEFTNADVNSTMPDAEINYAREWRTSYILPFLGHIAFERLECDETTTGGNNSSVFIRTQVNGAPIPLPGCQDGPGASCALSNFTEYIRGQEARFGDFIGACGINATNATNVLSIYS
ncbi:hypothetical protein M422DRAFT_245132 [Sphaerobolus stellatus SS14]|nr:hypothetical protein M422DRAFT_245132 [Sphaerobolus stellatus SS14]